DGTAHTVEFTYFKEGQQKTRTDLVDNTPKRKSTITYNPDGSQVQKIEWVDFVATSMYAQCNFDVSVSDPAQGYDANGNLKVTRTMSLAGTTTGDPCSSSSAVRLARRDYTYDEADRM